ncbi:recombinase family protein [Staphylococcus chromogenes]|uniref:recombinase family protein n=1 Tax=Staphylococcus chromogenes TaxID=46126 RepID=UPI0039E09B5C
MNVTVLAHNITDERQEFIDQPIETVVSYCKNKNYVITKIYDEDNRLINDIKYQKIKPECIVFWGICEDYPKLYQLCNKLNITLMSVFSILE